MPVNYLNEWVTSSFVKALSWTLIHSLWQGLAAAIIAGLIIILTRRSKAVVRYNLLTATLILFFSVSVSTFIWQYKFYQSSAIQTNIHNTVKEINDSAVYVSSNNEKADIYATLSDAFINFYEQHAPLVALIWFFLFLFHCIKLFSGFYYIQNIRSRKISPVPVEWKEHLNTLCIRLNIKQRVFFLQSEKIQVPVVLGYIKPTILVPLGMLANLPPEQVETILLHELAHIRRKDYIFNLLQSFAETIFFFNPAVTWISSLIREEREACCDDIVMNFTKDKTTYLQALVTFHHNLLQTHNYAMALGGNKSSLLNRVKRMLTYENNKLNIMEKILLFTGVILFTAFGFINAQDKVKQKAPPSPPVLSEQMQVHPEPVMPPAPPVFVKKAEPVISVNEKISAPDLVKDTVPKSGYTSIINNININGSQKTADYILKHENGTTYRIKKVNGVLKDFYVNDVRIADTELAAYKTVIDELDQVIQRDEELAAQRREEAKIKREEAKKMREEMQEKRKEEMGRRKLEQKENMQMQRKRAEEQREKMAIQREKQTELLRDQSEKRREKAKNNREILEKRKELNKIKTSKTNDDLNFIVNELMKEGVIDNNKKLEFTLDNNSLTVNGTKQNNELHKKLKEKYISKDGDYIKYSKDANNTIISINRN